MEKEPGLSLSHEQLLQKAGHFCAWRERCTREVQQKLQSLGASPAQSQKVIAQLMDEGFIDERRFALGFARGKLHNNQWGRVRIAMELRIRGIPEPLLNESLDQLNQQEYEQVLKKEAAKKAASLKGEHEAKAREKIAAFCIGKGFEPHLVWKLLDDK